MLSFFSFIFVLFSDKMAFAGILNDADITAALAACKGKILNLKIIIAT
jgi:hypothetical protein